MTPKSPEQIVEQYVNEFMPTITAHNPGEQDIADFVTHSYTKIHTDWLREALQSVILYAAEKARPKEAIVATGPVTCEMISQPIFRETAKAWNGALADYQENLKDFAQNI